MVKENSSGAAGQPWTVGRCGTVIPLSYALTCVPLSIPHQRTMTLSTEELVSPQPKHCNPC